MIGGHVSYASDTSYVELSDSAGRIINSQLSYSDPILRGTRNYSIVYGAGGNGFMVSDAKETNQVTVQFVQVSPQKTVGKKPRFIS